MRKDNSAGGALALGLIVMTLAGQCYGQLKIGFYNNKCKNNVDFDVEDFIRGRVELAFSKDPTLVAAMLRMLFHDCFVKGCDASLLLDGENTEKTAGPNRTVRGFELIDDIKRALEDEHLCPGIVSCADIIVIVTRVTVFLANGRTNYYTVETGRRDGVTSLASDARDNLPPPNVEVSKAISLFEAVGLTKEDFILLMGGHTVGIGHCALFENRLYNYKGIPGASDSNIDATFLQVLKTTCPQGGTSGNFVNLDQISPNFVDNSYYNSTLKRYGVLQIDQDIALHPATTKIVSYFAANGAVFNKKFGDALNNLARVGVLTGDQGQIRETCRMVNPSY